MITGLLLLAAFSWPFGDPYEQSGVFVAPCIWAASSQLCVPVKCWIKTCGVDLPSFQIVLSHFSGP